MTVTNQSRNELSEAPYPFCCSSATRLIDHQDTEKMPVPSGLEIAHSFQLEFGLLGVNANGG